jgi:hypothetical protein
MTGSTSTSPLSRPRFCHVRKSGLSLASSGFSTHSLAPQASAHLVLRIYAVTRAHGDHSHRHASDFLSSFEPSHLVLNAFRWIFLAPSYSWMFQLSNALTRARIRALCIPLSSSEVRAALLFLNLVAVLVPCHRLKQYSVSSVRQVRQSLRHNINHSFLVCTHSTVYRSGLSPLSRSSRSVFESCLRPKAPHFLSILC